MLILNYDEKGETNMPFKVSKISIVSTVNGQDVENSEAKWDINVIQNNDVYIYIENMEALTTALTTFTFHYVYIYISAC